MFMDTPPPPDGFDKKLEQVVVAPVQQVKKVRFWDAIYGVGMALTIEEIIDGIEQRVVGGLNQAKESFHTDPGRVMEARMFITPLEYARSIGREDLARTIERYAPSDNTPKELLGQLGQEALMVAQCCQPTLRVSEPFNVLDWFSNSYYFSGRTPGRGFLSSLFGWIDKKP